MTWHVAPETVAEWVAGTASETGAASVEAHVMRCAECRTRVSALPRRTDLGAVWSRVADIVESPSPNLLTRVMRVVGVNEADSFVLRAAPAYTAAWAVAVAVVVALTFVASTVNPDRMLMVYLLLAPLVPVAGIAAGYGHATDPTYEMAVAAPYSKLKILLLRGAAVLLGSIPVTCAVGLLLDPWWVAIAWLVPGLTAVLVMLALITWVAPIRAASAVGAAWTATCIFAMAQGDQMLLVGHVAMAIFAGASALALAVFASRIRLLSTAPRIGGV